MVHVPGRRDDHVGGHVVAAHEAETLLPREAAHVFGRAENRPRQRVRFKQRLDELFVRDVVGEILVIANLVENHLLLLLHFHRIVLGMAEDVAEDIERAGNPLIQHMNVKAGDFLGGEGVDVASPCSIVRAIS